MSAPPSSAPAVVPGQVLVGKYRVERVLGRGGMGVVVAAWHLPLGRRVALKFLLPSGAAQPDSLARFEREARAVAGLQGEHVARVLDVGTLEGGAPYIVMEYLEGADFARLVAERGPIGEAEAVAYVLQACEAVAEAHAHGVVHRDIKPANLFLTRRPDGSPLVKVLDFGISKAGEGSAATGPALTADQTALGSPRYMAPEQLTNSRTVDVRSDVWALGLVLYEITSGASPFAVSSLAELYAAVLGSPARPLREACPAVSPGLSAAVARCLEKDPARRFANVAELAAALAPFGGRAGGEAAGRVARVLGVDLVSALRPSQGPRIDAPAAPPLAAPARVPFPFEAPSTSSAPAGHVTPWPHARSGPLPPVGLAPPALVAPVGYGRPAALVAPVGYGPPAALAPPVGYGPPARSSSPHPLVIAVLVLLVLIGVTMASCAACVGALHH